MVGAITTHRKIRLVGRAGVAFLMCLLVLASCGDDSDEEVRNMRLTFDSSSCVYEGGDSLAAGPVSLEFLNQSDGRAGMNLVRHTGDQTIEDALAYIGDEPSSKSAPSWSRSVPGVWTTIPAGETRLWEGEVEPALHHMVCATMGPSPIQVWFGAGLTVTE